MFRLRRILADAENGEMVQGRLLRELLHRHQSTEYGRMEGLQNVAGWDAFRQHHPITNYSHYEPYIARIQAGEANVLAAGRPHLLAMTSAPPQFLGRISCVFRWAGVYFEHPHPELRLIGDSGETGVIWCGNVCGALQILNLQDSLHLNLCRILWENMLCGVFGERALPGYPAVGGRRTARRPGQIEAEENS